MYTRAAQQASPESFVAPVSHRLPSRPFSEAEEQTAAQRHPLDPRLFIDLSGDRSPTSPPSEADPTASEPNFTAEIEDARWWDARAWGNLSEPYASEAVANPPPVQAKCTDCEEAQQRQQEDLKLLQAKEAPDAAAIPNIQRQDSASTANIQRRSEVANSSTPTSQDEQGQEYLSIIRQIIDASAALLTDPDLTESQRQKLQDAVENARADLANLATYQESGSKESWLQSALKRIAPWLKSQLVIIGGAATFVVANNLVGAIFDDVALIPLAIGALVMSIGLLVSMFILRFFSDDTGSDGAKDALIQLKNSLETLSQIVKDIEANRTSAAQTGSFGANVSSGIPADEGAAPVPGSIAIAAPQPRQQPPLLDPWTALQEERRRQQDPYLAKYRELTNNGDPDFIAEIWFVLRGAFSAGLIGADFIASVEQTYREIVTVPVNDLLMYAILFTKASVKFPHNINRNTLQAEVTRKKERRLGLHDFARDVAPAGETVALLQGEEVTYAQFFDRVLEGLEQDKVDQIEAEIDRILELVWHIRGAELDPSTIREEVQRALLLYWTEDTVARHAIGGAPEQQPALACLFRTQSPTNQHNIEAKATRIFEAITRRSTPQTELHQKFYLALRNGILIHYHHDSINAYIARFQAGEIDPRCQDNASQAAQTPAEAIETSPYGDFLEQQIVSYRAALLNEIPAISQRFRIAVDNGILQAETFNAWDALSQQLIVLSVPTQYGGDPGEDQTDAAIDPQQAQEIIDQAQKLFSRLTIDMERSPPGAIPFIAPGVENAGDDIKELVDRRDWPGLYRRYYRMAIGFDQWLVLHGYPRDMRQAVDSEATERLEDFAATESNLSGQLDLYNQELKDFKERNKTYNLRPLEVFFQPTQPKEVEQSIPPIPLTMYYWEQGDVWHLAQVTPGNTYDNTINKTSPSQMVPPHALFEELNSKQRFPIGDLHYRIPGDRQGTVDVTGELPLGDWLSGLGFFGALLGLGMMAAGAATAFPPLVVWGTWTIVASSAVSAAGNVAYIHEHLQHGSPDVLKISIEVTSLVSNVLGGSALAANKIRRGVTASARAAATSQLNQLYNFVEGAYVPLVQVTIAADSLSLALLTADATRQTQAILESPGDDEQRQRALTILFAQLAIAGGLTILSIRGDIADIQAGRPVYFDEIVDPQGNRILAVRREGAEAPPSDAPDSQRPSQQPDLDLPNQQPGPELTAPETAPTPPRSAPETAPSTRSDTTPADPTRPSLDEDIASSLTPTPSANRLGFDPEATQEFLLNQEFRDALAAADDDWQQLKNMVLNRAGNEELMMQFVNYRERVYKYFVAEVRNKYPSIRGVVIGSKTPTSDVDMTVVSDVDPILEALAVAEFNEQFRQVFQKESGVVFDVNVYTISPMPRAALGDRLDELKALREVETYLSLRRDIGEFRTELETLQSDTNRYREIRDKIETMQARLDDPEEVDKMQEHLQRVNELRISRDPSQRLPEDSEVGELPENINDLRLADVSRETRRARERLQSSVAAEETYNQVSPEAQQQILADQDVYARLQQRQNMSAEEWANYRTQIVDKTDDPMQAATTARLDRTEALHDQLEQELTQMIRELSPDLSPEERATITPANADPNTKFAAYNRLFEYYLFQSANIRKQLDALRAMRADPSDSQIEESPPLTPAQVNQEIDRLTVELNTLTSHALYFANESHYTSSALITVVLNQQSGLELPVSLAQYPISVVEHFGFALANIKVDNILAEQIRDNPALLRESGLNSEQLQVGQALVKISKYMDRVNLNINAMKELLGNSQQLLTPELNQRATQFGNLFEKLLRLKKSIKEYYQVAEIDKPAEAFQVAGEYGFTFNTLEELREAIRNFSADLDPQLRQHSPEQYGVDHSSQNAQIQGETQDRRNLLEDYNRLREELERETEALLQSQHARKDSLIAGHYLELESLA